MYLGRRGPRADREAAWFALAMLSFVLLSALATSHFSLFLGLIVGAVLLTGYWLQKGETIKQRLVNLAKGILFIGGKKVLPFIAFWLLIMGVYLLMTRVLPMAFDRARTLLR